jgi:hypothetical protein
MPGQNRVLESETSRVVTNPLPLVKKVRSMPCVQGSVTHIMSSSELVPSNSSVWMCSTYSYGITPGAPRPPESPEMLLGHVE